MQLDSWAALWFKLWHGSFPVRGMIGLTIIGAGFVLAGGLAGRADALTIRSRHLA